MNFVRITTCKYCDLEKIHFARELCKNCYWKIYRKINKDKIKQRNHKYYIKNKVKLKLQKKNYRENHKNEIREYKRKWYQNNREKLLVKAKEYRNKNINKKREFDKLYWQREYVKIKDNFRKRLGRYGRTFAKNAIIIKNLANHRCVGCGSEDNGQVFNVHHIIPFTLIRNNELWNLEYLCKSCHIKRERYFKNLAKKLAFTIPSLKNLSK